MENTKFTISSSPHLRARDTVQSVMGDVLIALLPATVASIYFFRMGAALNIVFGILGAVLGEAFMQKVMKKDLTLYDLSAVVTGLLLAFNVPPSAPLWMTFVGGAFATIFGKMIFGGLGHNYINPALVARAMLLASWPVHMTAWVEPVTKAVSSAATDEVVAVTATTPLAYIKLAETGVTKASLMDMFLGNIPGTIGETSALLLLVGGAYLLYKGVINYIIPFTYIATVFILTFLFSGFDLSMGLYNVLGGGLILGAFYMATDYTTSPMYKKAQVIYAIGCGVLTSVIRYFGGYPEGVSYSILLMNVCTPLLDKYVRPTKFGEVKKDEK